jgi:hypothetical protein
LCFQFCCYQYKKKKEAYRTVHSFLIWCSEKCLLYIFCTEFKVTIYMLLLVSPPTTGASRNCFEKLRERDSNPQILVL